MEGFPANDNTNKAPTRGQVENALEKLRADRTEYVHRLTESNKDIRGSFEILEALSADAQLADFDEKIKTLEKGLELLPEDAA